MTGLEALLAIARLRRQQAGVLDDNTDGDADTGPVASDASHIVLEELPTADDDAVK